MFPLIKKILIELLTGTGNVSNHAKCVLLSNQKCMTQPTLFKVCVPDKKEHLNLTMFNNK